MILKLKSKKFRDKLENNLDNYLYYSTINQLRDTHDPKLIIWDNLRLPMGIKLTRQIDAPIDNQLENTHI